MTRALVLALLLPVVGWADGDYTTNSTVDANVDRVVFATTAAHRITGAHTLACSWRGTDNALASRMVARSTADTASNYNLRLTATGTTNIRSSAGAVDGAGYNVSSSSTSAHDGARHHGAVVFGGDATTAVNYYDGVAENTDATVLATDDPATGISFGATGNGSGGYNAGFDSLMIQGETRLYSAALEAGEVSQIAAANSFRRPFRSLVGHWQQLGTPGTSFGGANTVMDYSTGKVHGDGNDGSPDPTYAVMMARGAGR